MKTTNNQFSKYHFMRFALLAFLILVGNVFSLNAQEGEFLFKVKCATCHQPHNDGTGPKLFEVRKKWEEGGAKSGSILDWVRNWQKAAANDPYAQQVTQWSPNVMTIFSAQNWTDDQINAIFDYVDARPFPALSASGAVSIPEMNVLYRGYENKVVGAVSGFTSYNLSITNGSISRKDEEWIVKPGNGKECLISIYGIAEDGSSANVGTFKYRVSNLPAPNINLGNIINGNSSSANAIKLQSKIFAKYPPEIPLDAEFIIKNYTIFVSGISAAAKGNGDTLDNNAKSILMQAPKGGTVVIKTTVIYPNGSEWKVSGVYYVE